MENSTEPKTIEVIPDKAIMSIKVSGTFYKRVQALFIYLSQKKDPKEFLAYYAQMLKGGEPKDEYEFHLYTVLSLLVEIENEAKSKELTEQKELPDGPMPSEN